MLIIIMLLNLLRKKQCTIIDPVENEEFTLTNDEIKNFKLPYANTCDSVQGLSIKDKIIIFDCNTPYVDTLSGQQ